MPALKAIPAAGRDLGHELWPRLRAHEPFDAPCGDRRPGLRDAHSGNARPERPRARPASSGFFWFHPHSHGYKGPLFAGAMTGGFRRRSVRLRLRARRPQRLRAGPAGHLALSPSQGRPGRAAGQGLAAALRPRPESRGRLRERRPRGAGARRVLELYGPALAIHGQRTAGPQVTDVAPGRTEVWRIVNASADVAYRLSLRPKADVMAAPCRSRSCRSRGPRRSRRAGRGRSKRARCC